VRELTQELSDVPSEVRAARARSAAAAALAARQRAEAAAGTPDGGEEVEGLVLSRAEAKRLKAARRCGGGAKGVGGAGRLVRDPCGQQNGCPATPPAPRNPSPPPTPCRAPPGRAGLAARGLLNDIADDVAPAAAPGPGGAGGAAAAAGRQLGELFGRQRLSQKFGADISAQLRAGRGGDDDLPARAPLAERRAKFDAVAARRVAGAGGGGGGGGGWDDEDEFDYEVCGGGGGGWVNGSHGRGLGAWEGWRPGWAEGLRATGGQPFDRLGAAPTKLAPRQPWRRRRRASAAATALAAAATATTSTPPPPPRAPRPRRQSARATRRPSCRRRRRTRPWTASGRSAMISKRTAASRHTGAARQLAGALERRGV
jgi:hypothetical protein